MHNDQIPSSFRQDLKLFAGPVEEDGSPTYNIYDPVRAKYYKINWKEHYIYKIAKPGLTISEINQRIKRSTTIHVDDEDIEHFFKLAERLGLLNKPVSGDQIEKRSQRKKTGIFTWLIFNYLYIRLPLFSPDVFLTRTLPYVTVFWSKSARLLYLLLFCIALVVVGVEWENYWRSLTYFFSWKGLAAYLITVFSVKIVHELAHAYTAKRYGIHVSTMGVALIILYPVLYTDVTHSWALSNRKHRLAISVAGVISELVVAVIATCLWAILSPGLLRSACFLLSSTSWILSVFINFNPVMRFDGYYMLADFWGVDNLRSRSFALGKWKMRERLFGLKEDSPEQDMSPLMQAKLIIYAYISWVYLFMLYTTIALVVYHKFTKSLGIILFLLEIAVFFVWPVVSEVKYMLRAKEKITSNFRLLATVTVTIALLFWLAYPMSHRETFPAVTIPENAQHVYAPIAGIVESLDVDLGDSVQKGDLVAVLSSRRLDTEIAVAKANVAFLQRSYEIISQSKELNELLLSKRAELAAAHRRLKKLLAGEKQLTIRSLLEGEVYEWNDLLREGEWVQKGEVIGKIAPLNQVSVIAYVPEKKRQGLEVGQSASFRSMYSLKDYSGTINRIRKMNTANMIYPALSSEYGGSLMVRREPEGNLQLVDTYYEVEMHLESNEKMPFGKVGEMNVMIKPRSLLYEWYLWIAALLVAESNP